MSAMLAGRVIRNMALGARTVAVLLAEVVQEKSFKRVIDAIEPAIIDETAERVENAFKGLRDADRESKERNNSGYNYICRSSKGGPETCLHNLIGICCRL